MANKFCDLVLLGIKQYKHCYLIANELHLQKSSAIYILLINRETIRRPEFEECMKITGFCSTSHKLLLYTNAAIIIFIQYCKYNMFEYLCLIN